MKRGDIVTVAISGDFGKPRPAVIVQSETLTRYSTSFIICQMTSVLTDLPQFRMTIDPSEGNGLRSRSQIMVDRPTTVRKDRVGQKIGSLSVSDINRLNKVLLSAFGLFD